VRPIDPAIALPKSQPFFSLRPLLVEVHSLIEQLLSNPIQVVVLLVQFFLGLGLGYVSARALKYVLAFMAILVLGSLLNVWSLGLSLEGLGSHLLETWNYFKGLAQLLGLLTIGPTAIGFVVGAIIALLKR